jgi:hypothetical protein
MKRDEVISRARAAGLVVEPCASPEFIGIRSYKPDTDECMRMGSGGEMYTRGEDGWMYQVGTVSDVDHYVKTLEAQQ